MSIILSIRIHMTAVKIDNWCDKHSMVPFGDRLDLCWLKLHPKSVSLQISFISYIQSIHLYRCTLCWKAGGEFPHFFSSCVIDLHYKKKERQREREMYIYTIMFRVSHSTFNLLILKAMATHMITSTKTIFRMLMFCVLLMLSPNS